MGSLLIASYPNALQPMCLRWWLIVYCVKIVLMCDGTKTMMCWLLQLDLWLIRRQIHFISPTWLPWLRGKFGLGVLHVGKILLSFVHVDKLGLGFPEALRVLPWCSTRLPFLLIGPKKLLNPASYVFLCCSLGPEAVSAVSSCVWDFALCPQLGM